jgi:3-hydroxy-9,10-secoandrosta-1,3,5(10)-triene-9,17-dione monooxygenase
VMVGGVIPDEGPFMFLLPVADVEVDDVWHMSGMSGTGSNDMVITSAYVPEYRVVSTLGLFSGTTEGSAIHENPFYSIPLFPFLYCEAMPVFSGGLRGATNSFDATVQDRITTHGLAAMKESQHAHVLLGGAHAKADVAEVLVREQVRQTLAVHAGAGFEIEDRLRLKGRAGFIVSHCREAVTEMMQHAGTANFRDDVPLQRFFRDLNMLSTHAFWEWDASREQLGRHRVGLDLNSPLV